jgi:hypothetical protein
MNNNEKAGGMNFLRRTLAIPAWLLVLIAVGAILASLLRITIPDFVWGLILLLLILLGFSPGGGSLNPGSSKELSDPDSGGRKIEVSNYPAYAKPTLLPIESRASLQNLERDSQIGVITSVVGDLVFAVNTFSSPVNMIIKYTPDDEEALRAHQQTLSDEVKLVPIYLQTEPLEEGKPITRVWKPFPDSQFRIDRSKREITVAVSSWGDQPIGIGTKP